MATKKPKGLGLGLEALLGPRVFEAGDRSEQAADSTPRTLKLEQLRPGKYQPRTRMDEGALYELAESIKAQGIMQPVLVRRLTGQSGGAEVGALAGFGGAENASSANYEVIAGERRVRAARLAGLTEVPVLVRDVADEAAAAMALIENIQREDLNPLEEAQGLKRLTDEFGLTHEAAAQSVGRSRSAASNLLRLLNLTDAVQEMLMAGDLDMGHARALLPLEGAEQILAANEIIAKKLSVREAEALVTRKGASTGRQVRLLKARNEKPRDLQRIEQLLSDALTAAVDIRVKKRTARGEQGEVAIQFGSLDELNGLLQKLGLDAA
jgi:ParB family chromosome partitioning protein